MSQPPRWFLPCIVAAALWAAYHAWLYRFLCDDAYISFRYVENLVNGRGLVFNPGERVEGYTNFLWVLELAALRWITGLAIEPLAFTLSSLYSIGFFAVAIAFALRTPIAANKYAICLVTVILLAINRTVAVWATSGLETRQFSFFVVLAMYLLATGSPTTRRTAAASVVMALAALTRPDTLLIWGCAGLWMCTVHGSNLRAVVKRCLAWGIPFAIIVGAHFIWRYSYYGDWLPNTYYAKVIGAWWDGGRLFFTVAAIENVLFLFVPLFLIGAWNRERQHRDYAFRLFLFITVPHAIYWARAGGDHFEYRIIDFWWPLLTLGAVEGAFIAGRWIAARISKSHNSRAFAIATAVMLAVVALYMYGFQQLKTRPTPETEPAPIRTFIGSDRKLFVDFLPGAPWLIDVYHRTSGECLRKFIAVPHLRHRELWLHQRDGFAPYTITWDEKPLPEGLVTVRSIVGIAPYYLRDVTVIDNLGLTDAYVARMRMDIDPDDRRLAHDRKAPDSYLQERGCNVEIYPALSTRDRALIKGNYAVKLANDIWMPVRIYEDAVDEEWMRETFAEFEVWRLDEGQEAMRL